MFIRRSATLKRNYARRARCALRVLAICVACIPAILRGEPAVARAGMVLESRDTLSIGEEEMADARACLDGLAWRPVSFKVRCEPARPRCGDLLIRFSSPVVSGDATNDLVAMEWYMPRDENFDVPTAPAVVVVHESGRDMLVGRMVARGLQVQGLHALMIQLPYYGERRPAGVKPKQSDVISVMRQAIADVRRARDVAAVLPHIDAHNISLQGTSLGGFVAATTAGLDRGYAHVFIMLAGGDLCNLIENGVKDAKNLRKELAAAGIEGELLKELLSSIEPTRLAHRVDCEQTWLFSAKYDQVVPIKHAHLLAQAMQLDDSHHVKLLANHYSGVVFLPHLWARMRKEIHTVDPYSPDKKSGRR